MLRIEIGRQGEGDGHLHYILPHPVALLSRLLLLPHIRCLSHLLQRMLIPADGSGHRRLYSVDQASATHPGRMEARCPPHTAIKSNIMQGRLEAYVLEIWGWTPGSHQRA
jgi:hypothetical protein